ncbi:hypothetical protein [Halorubrum sp. N11]|uniref:hypothetical protein n=1 Tax=Halorubrum sp. N11 TaxID=3402276 RepID=UPI003EB77D13
MYLIEGAIELELGDEIHELFAGDVARFDGDQEIAPYAVEESTAPDRLVVWVRRVVGGQRTVRPLHMADWFC